ncbi:MAG: hypothetical protein ACI4XL_13515 [Bacillus sp. (in: firmicutes)]
MILNNMMATNKMIKSYDDKNEKEETTAELPLEAVDQIMVLPLNDEQKTIKIRTRNIHFL